MKALTGCRQGGPQRQHLQLTVARAAMARSIARSASSTSSTSCTNNRQHKQHKQHKLHEQLKQRKQHKQHKQQAAKAAVPGCKLQHLSHKQKQKRAARLASHWAAHGGAERTLAILQIARATANDPLERGTFSEAVPPLHECGVRYLHRSSPPKPRVSRTHRTF